MDVLHVMNEMKYIPLCIFHNYCFTHQCWNTMLSLLVCLQCIFIVFSSCYEHISQLHLHLSDKIYF